MLHYIRWKSLENKIHGASCYPMNPGNECISGNTHITTEFPIIPAVPKEKKGETEQRENEDKNWWFPPESWIEWPPGCWDSVAVVSSIGLSIGSS